jgi:CBS domain-containing protein
MSTSPGAAATAGGVRPPTVGSVMRPPVTTVELRAHLAAAAYLMKRSGDSALVVTRADDLGVPIGIVTDADISQAVADGRDPEQIRVSDVMTGSPVVAPDTSIGDALRSMVQRRIHHLLVATGGKLVGIVDMMDLCRAAIGADLPWAPAAGADGTVPAAVPASTSTA